MRTLLAVLLLTAVTQAYPQAIEADLDGNASSLEASELQTKPQQLPRQTRLAPQPRPDRRLASLATRK
jgi:hypothetical protein